MYLRTTDPARGRLFHSPGHTCCSSIEHRESQSIRVKLVQHPQFVRKLTSANEPLPAVRRVANHKCFQLRTLHQLDRGGGHTDTKTLANFGCTVERQLE